MTKIKEAIFTDTVFVSIEFQDNESLGEFLRWEIDQKVYRNIRVGSCGMKSYTGFYAKKDANRIKKYLLYIIKSKKQIKTK